mgnify:CR=1 FL=1
MTKNKKVLSLLNIGMIISLGGMSANSYAETKFTPKFEIGSGSYELELTRPTQQGGNITEESYVVETAEATFMTYAIGGAFSFDQFMIDVTYKGSASGTQDYANGSDLCGTGEDACGIYGENDGDFSHSELAFTLGYQIDSFVLYAGYHMGETTFDHNFTYILEEDNIWSDPNFGDVTMDWFGVEVDRAQLTNETTGFFLGGAYGFPIGESGSISLAAGYSIFDVDVKEIWEWDGVSSFSSGEGAGMSLAATYNYHLEDGRVYVKFDFQSYTQDSFSNYTYDNGDPESEFAPDDSNENFYRFSVGYSF